jgi:hypothetical protein
MKVIEVRVDATLRKAEYESEKVGVTAIVEETEDYRNVIQELKDFIYGKKTSDKKTKTSVVKEEIQETAKEEIKVEEIPTPVKKEKKTKEKFETYDRANQVHKKLMSKILDEKYPNWESDTSKAAAASRMMVGENFLDKEGNILQEFIEKVCKLMDV